MEIAFWVIMFIIVLAGLFFYHNNKNKTEYIVTDTKLKEIKEKLEQEQEKLKEEEIKNQAEYADWKKKIELKIQEYGNQQKRIGELNEIIRKMQFDQEKIVDDNIHKYEKEKKARIDSELSLYAMDIASKKDTCQFEYNNFITELTEKKSAAQADIENTLKELDLLKEQHKAAIDANKLLYQEAEEKEFHRIQLTQEQLEDIEYITSIFGKLHNRQTIAKVVWENYVQTPAKELINRIIGQEKVTGVYRIASMNNQMCYIGQGVNVGDRLLQHIKGSLGIQSIADQRIHHVMLEEGLNNWSFELLETCDKSLLNERERYWIDFFKSNEYGYNKTKGNGGK